MFFYAQPCAKETCHITSLYNLPVIVINARSEDSDKLEALYSDADDYLTKPFSVEELFARLRATKRRLDVINVGKVLTHTYITQKVWGSSWKNDVASLRVFMATLRKKLEAEPDSLQYIHTHIGIGYRVLKVE